MIEIKNLTKKFGTKTVLDNINLKINKGKIHFIIGMSGMGKTVFVKQIVGLLKPNSGKIIIENQDISNLDEKNMSKIYQKITYVFQNSTLFDHLTVYQNIELPIIKNKKYIKNQVSKHVYKYINLLNLDDYKNFYPHELGESLKKRVAIARALAIEPQYIIYDEPTTGLSFSEARNIDKLIYDMSRKLQVTAIVISHDLESIKSISDRITMLHNGHILLDGSINDFKNSNNEIIKQFINAKEYLF